MGKRKRSGSWSKGDESGSKKSDDCDSQEEMDGDMFAPKTSATNTNVRCSARVQEKQEKLRREASPSKICSSESGCAGLCGTPGGSINNQCKGKIQISTCDEISVTVSEGINYGTGGINTESDQGKRKKRTWELWSQYDKQLFFEALNEFGKDFDAIQSYLASKLKSKNKTVEPTQIKKKEQVRHFYYRTWNKIQKYLRFPKDMKKAYQELYGLVNYGELRKKQRVLNGKTAAKLLELVEKGSTTIKVKGKTQRIKTPVCQALKKINNLTDVEQTKVPAKVVVELLPKDGGAWSVVQSLSHNPRVRSLVSLQRTLASIISYLEERWKSSSDRIKEQMMTTFGKSSSRHLRVIPSSKYDTNVPIFKTYETASSAKISLNAYSTNVLNKTRKDGYIKFIEKRKRTKSGSVLAADAANDSHAEADWSDAEAEVSLETKDEIKDEVTEEVKEDGIYRSLATQIFRNAFGDDTLEVKGMPEDEVQRMLKSVYAMPRLHNQEDDDFDNGYNDNYHHDSDDYQNSHKSSDFKLDSAEVGPSIIGNGSVSTAVPKLLESTNCACSPSEDKSAEPEEIFASIVDEEVLKRGWTAEEAATLTIGEVYMLVGRNEKLSFEYEWDEVDEDVETKKRTKIMLDRLIAVARNLKKKKQSRHKLVSGSIGPTLGACPSCGQSATNTPVSIGPQSVIPGVPVQLADNSVKIPVTSPSSLQSMSTTQLSIGTSPPIGASTVISTPHPPVISLGSSIAPLTSEEYEMVKGTIITIANPTSVQLSSKPSALSSAVESEPSTMARMKKIVPTLVSSSCSGTILKTIPLAPKPDPQLGVKDSQTSEDLFRVPALGNGSAATAVRSIRPAHPLIAPNDTLSTEDNLSAVNSRNSKTAPKPFLDLPKGNRRLGRPCCKKNIVPRYLPLLPKATDVAPQPPVWDLVPNKAPVHALYVSNSAQIMLPVTSISLKASPNPPIVAVAVVSGGDKEEVPQDALGQEPVQVGTEKSTPAVSSKVTAQQAIATMHPLSKQGTSNEQLNGSQFQDLIQVSSIESEKIESNLSLSSFMDISLPESTRNAANECLKSEKFLDVTLGSSSCSLSLSNFLSTVDSNNASSELNPHQTHRDESASSSKKPSNYVSSSPPMNLLATDSQQWLSTEGNELSLSSLLLSTLEPVASNENEMNFQSIIDDSNNHLDFTSKFSELVAELESNNTGKK